MPSPVCAVARCIIKTLVSWRIYALCAALLVAASAASAAPPGVTPTDPTGDWLVAKGIAIIRIVNCDGQYWGVVAWEQNPGVDRNNPDPTKRNRPTLGMPILLGMTQTNPYQWSGQIYNSQDGRIYSSSISLSSPDVLRVQGCVFGFLCGSENWTRITPQNTVGAAGPSSGPRASQPGKPPAPLLPQSAEDICLALVGSPGSPHQRGLK
jgi:uncharacterized protein (DUF2147 family)